MIRRDSAEQRELVLDELEERGYEILDRVDDRATDRGITVETELCHERPPQEITDYADEIGTDLIVVGYQGQSH